MEIGIGTLLALSKSSASKSTELQCGFRQFHFDGHWPRTYRIPCCWL